MSVRGLGLKSVECIRLLTLHHPSFPVRKNLSFVIYLHKLYVHVTRVFCSSLQVLCYVDREISLCTPFCVKLRRRLMHRWTRMWAAS